MKSRNEIEPTRKQGLGATAHYEYVFRLPSIYPSGQTDGTTGTRTGRRTARWPLHELSEAARPPPARPRLRLKRKRRRTKDMQVAAAAITLALRQSHLEYVCSERSEPAGSGASERAPFLAALPPSLPPSAYVFTGQPPRDILTKRASFLLALLKWLALFCSCFQSMFAFLGVHS